MTDGVERRVDFGLPCGASLPFVGGVRACYPAHGAATRHFGHPIASAAFAQTQFIGQKKML
jgi:hypothetical protein